MERKRLRCQIHLALGTDSVRDMEQDLHGP